MDQEDTSTTKFDSTQADINRPKWEANVLLAIQNIGHDIKRYKKLRKHLKRSLKDTMIN